MDLALKESLDGGEFVRKGNDLLLTGAIYNQIYLALFGGNVEQRTVELSQDSNRFRKDWWGNQLFFPNSPNSQFNSQLERALNETAISSGGLLKLEAVAKDDLRFLTDIGTVEVDISLIEHEKIRIAVSVFQKENLRENDFVFIWNQTKLEQIADTEESIVKSSFPVIYPWFFGVSTDGIVGNVDIYADGTRLTENIGNFIVANYASNGWLWFAVPSEENNAKTYTEWEDFEDDGNSNGIGNSDDLFGSSSQVSVPEIGIDYDLYFANYFTNGFKAILR